MTAINPAKLKIQCVELSELYSDPEQFIQRLHELKGYRDNTAASVLPGLSSSDAGIGTGIG
jgi:hypothetical protein